MFKIKNLIHNASVTQKSDRQKSVKILYIYIYAYMYVDLKNHYRSLSTLGVPSPNHAFNDHHIDSLSRVGLIMHVHAVVENSNAFVEP